MSPASINKIAILKDRALMLKKARLFFEERRILEVDVPILSQEASVDEHIDLIAARACGKTHYLHSSPEYGMKRLLSLGIGDIYQLSHVFRDHEKGERHQIEFMMAEWYRLKLSFEEMIEETIEFVRLFIPINQVETLTYKEAFLKYVGMDPAQAENKDYLLAFEIEPKLGKDRFTVIRDFPPESAALSKVVTKEGEPVALRFELFYQGIELANGYQELTDPEQQYQRLIEANKARKEQGKDSYPIDSEFIEALKAGIPECTGVAVGFDRLMMLKHQVKDIKEVVSLPCMN